MSKWRDVSSDLPDWKDTGPAELRREDGSVEVIELDIVDVQMGDPEIPIFEYTTKDGRKLDIHSFDKWRLLKT